MTSERRSAFEKIQETAKGMRNPRSGAAGPELALATLTQGLSSPQAKAWLQAAQAAGELDPFLEMLAVWLCAHRSDDSPLLVVLELPRYHELPSGTVLHRVEQARAVALGPPPDLAGSAEEDEGPAGRYQAPPKPLLP